MTIVQERIKELNDLNILKYIHKLNKMLVEPDTYNIIKHKLNIVQQTMISLLLSSIITHIKLTIS